MISERFAGGVATIHHTGPDVGTLQVLAIEIT